MKGCLIFLTFLLLVNFAIAEEYSMLRGIVNDDLGNLVGDAELKFQCSNPLSEYPKVTDKFGSFFIKKAPHGTCRIFAMHRGKMSYTDVQINSSFHDVEIHIKRGSLWILILPLLILITLVILILLWLKKIKIKKVDSKDRMTSIIKTLPPKEKKIIQYLLNNNNKANNASIKHELQIPRTSLSRIVASLENKHLVIVEKHGKSLKLQLTDFFLSGKDLEQK